MKRIITSLFLATCAISATAQPTVIPTGHPALGFSSNVYMTDSADAGASGANVTWDFSNLDYENLGSLTVVDASTSPHAAKYNTSNLCLEIEAMGVTIYNYYKSSGSGISKMGEGVSNVVPSEIDYLQDDRQWLKFPFNFNDVLVDTWDGALGNGTDTILYDGYGTLITPFDTFTNVIRTRTITTEAGFAPDTTYTWFATLPVVFEIMEMSTDGGLLIEEMPQVAVGINAVTKNNPLRVYPNPATAYITIDAGNIKGEVGIYDISGRLLKQATTNGQPLVIPTNDLKPGTYFYKMAGTNSLEYKGTFTIN